MVRKILEELPGLVVADAQTCPAPQWLRTELVAVAGRRDSVGQARKHLRYFVAESARDQNIPVDSLAEVALESLAAAVTRRAVRAAVNDILGNLLFNGYFLRPARGVVQQYRMAWTLQEHTALDLAGATFKKFFQLLQAGEMPPNLLEDEQKFQAWIYVVCCREGVDMMRYWGKRIMSRLPTDAPETLADDAAQRQENSDTLADLRALCVDDLERNVVEQKVQGRNFRETAEALGLTPCRVRAVFGKVAERAHRRLPEYQ
jgi:DNA-directed RNA polymerase specialized sigma24 family protein